ncbi:NHLP-related RiPP peptide [Arenimonas alkanexedens]
MANKLSEKTVDVLLDKLSSDDDFRARFQKNPREATRSLGTGDPAVDTLPEAPIAELADKKSLSASRDKVRESLVSAAYPFQPIHLDMPKR